METETISDLFERIQFRGNPIANPKSMVVSGHARFTVLTPRLLRMEWSETGAFEDRGTYAFPIRFAPVPEYITQLEGDTLVLRTSALELRYQQGSGKFTPENLSITFELLGVGQRWVPGMPNPHNLRGTRRTLDMCERDAALDEGLLSRAGWVLFDDIHSVLFNLDDGWVAPRPDYEVQDWYLFCYGHDYKLALAEYLRFGGPIPLIPRFVLGAWWSRFWAYSAQDLKNLVEDFEAHDLPLDVLVVDMDWHTPHSWTGYTWNRELFPDPEEFIQWVHAKGLRVTLNLHPAERVQPFEEIYYRFSEAMGVDPKSTQPIPFRITDKKFVQNYFHLLHYPLEEQGVDFWWIDWQQGETTEMKRLDALTWLNHLHFMDSKRRGQRPMLYSRWGGLGNHRYHIGFSGDTLVFWWALQFQPYFTATAANVCYGWWSHDIGGHMGGATEPELYARWVQFGALSPCLRLHSTKDERCERRPWMYPEPVYEATKAAFHLRYQLIPYIYTMARVASDTGIMLCRPMYYEYPEDEAAYTARYQYFFGDQMIASPILFPSNPETGLAATDIWVPKGTWIDFFTKEAFAGPRWVRLVGDIHRIPILVISGAVIPMTPKFGPQPSPWLASGTTEALPRDRLILSVFPGKEGKFRLYEDDGITPAYQNGQFEWTEITTTMKGLDIWEVHIAPVEGQCDVLPERRAYEIRLEGSRRPEEVLVDGEETTEWDYDPANLVTTVYLPLRNKRKPTTIVAIGKGGLSGIGEAHNRKIILSDVRQLLGNHYLEIDDDREGLIQAVLSSAAPGKVDAIARLGGPFVRVIEFVAPEEAAQQLGRIIVSGTEEPYDLEVNFTLYKAGESQRHTIVTREITQSQIIGTPFSFDGQVQTMRWKAEIKVRWHGETLTHTHLSDLLFPSIYTWKSLFYNRTREIITIEQVMNKAGRLNQAQDWKNYSQSTERLPNLNQPYWINFSEAIQDELEAGEPLAGYLAATIISPEVRQVALLFQGEGNMDFYLNGQKLKNKPKGVGQLVPPFLSIPWLHEVRRIEGLRLKKGENTLVIHTSPLQDELTSWYLGGVFVTPEGEWISDLVIKN